MMSFAELFFELSVYDREMNEQSGSQKLTA